MTINISDQQTKISNPQGLAKLIVDILKRESENDKNKEHFWGIYFNSRSIIKKIELISLGCLNASIVHPRETFSPAISCNSVSLVVVHNHPSGNTEPSLDDITITQRLKQAGQILGIELVDHLIVTLDGSYYSFKEHNALWK